MDILTPPPLLGARAGPIANSCLAPEADFQAPGGTAVLGHGQCGRKATGDVTGESQDLFSACLCTLGRLENREWISGQESQGGSASGLEGRGCGLQAGSGVLLFPKASAGSGNACVG